MRRVVAVRLAATTETATATLGMLSGLSREKRALREVEMQQVCKRRTEVIENLGERVSMWAPHLVGLMQGWGSNWRGGLTANQNPGIQGTLTVATRAPVLRGLSSCRILDAVGMAERGPLQLAVLGGGGVVCCCCRLDARCGGCPTFYPARKKNVRLQLTSGIEPRE